jgi:hypothetical protein
MSQHASGNCELQCEHDQSQFHLLILSACQDVNGAVLGFLQTGIVLGSIPFINCPGEDLARHVLGRNQVDM